MATPRPCATDGLPRDFKGRNPVQIPPGSLNSIRQFVSTSSPYRIVSSTEMFCCDPPLPAENSEISTERAKSLETFGPSQIGHTSGAHLTTNRSWTLRQEDRLMDQQAMRPAQLLVSSKRGDSYEVFNW
jgi:hypothetical protein